MCLNRALQTMEQQCRQDKHSHSGKRTEVACTETNVKERRITERGEHTRPTTEGGGELDSVAPSPEILEEQFSVTYITKRNSIQASRFITAWITSCS